jgi:hypothetical protein
MTETLQKATGAETPVIVQLGVMDAMQGILLKGRLEGGMYDSVLMGLNLVGTAAYREGQAAQTDYDTADIQTRVSDMIAAEEKAEGVMAAKCRMDRAVELALKLAGGTIEEIQEQGAGE